MKVAIDEQEAMKASSIRNGLENGKQFMWLNALEKFRGYKVRKFISDLGVTFTQSRKSNTISKS